MYDEYTQSISAAYQNRIVVLRKSAVQFIMLCAELAGIFFHGSPFLLERTIKLRFVQIWVFGRQFFFWKLNRKPVTPRKTDNICC